MGDAVCLAFLHSDDMSVSFTESRMHMLMRDAAGAGRIMRGGYIGWRAGHDQLALGRNNVVEQFLADDKADWLLWIDTDMGFTPDLLDRLMETADPEERPVVGALCFGYRDIGTDGMGGMIRRPFPTLFQWAQVGDKSGFHAWLRYPVNQLVRVDGTGSACVLIHRSVFERIGSDWYTRVPNPTTPEKGLISEDLSFCVRCGAEGIPIHVHTGIRTTHHKQLFVSEADFWQYNLAAPATERVAVVVPVLSRPENVKSLVDSLRASSGLAEAYFVCDADDAAEQAAVLAAGGQVITFKGDRPGTFAEKANLGYDRTVEPWLFLCGDDVRFYPGWYDQAISVASQFGANVVGTNDLGNPRVLRGEHATHMLVRRSYVDEVGASWDGPGVLCHEGYRHWYVDDEIVTAAKQRGVWQMALGSVVEHLHPRWGKAQVDDVYRIGQESTARDRDLFQRRAKERAA